MGKVTLKVVVDDSSVRANREEVSVSGDFEVEIVNRGQPSHVTLSLEGDAAESMALVEDAVFVDDRESVEVNVGLSDVEKEGLLKVSAGFDSEEARTVLRVEPAGVDALESDPAYESSAPETTGDEPRVDLLVAGVLGFAVVVLFVFAALFGEWTLALVLSVVVATGVAVMWLFKNYDAVTGYSGEPDSEHED